MIDSLVFKFLDYVLEVAYPEAFQEGGEFKLFCIEGKFYKLKIFFTLLDKIENNSFWNLNNFLVELLKEDKVAR